jgi:class 3 adenylate cyclase
VDYGAIGTVTNLAARLCGEAKGGQILVSSRVAGAVEELADLEEVATMTLKGFLRPVPTFNVVGLKTSA